MCEILNQACEKMKESGKSLALIPIGHRAPRAHDHAWKLVASAYDTEFVNAHYSELQAAFDLGLKEGNSVRVLKH